jgi:hypothetical protein
MFEDGLFKLNTSVADSLNNIQPLKNMVVGLQQYEYAAKLRDIEKKIEEASELISHLGSPATRGNSKTGGELFFKQLFLYAAVNNWTIPTIFSEAFKQRKSKLNAETVFTDGHTAHLIALNKKLHAEEEKIIEFLNFLKYVFSVKDLDITLNTGNITILCQTDTTNYTYFLRHIGEEKPFYNYTFPVNDLLNSTGNYYKTDKTINAPDNEFLKPFPLKFRDENICFFFYVLANDSSLSLSDLLNISTVDVALDAKYGFGESEIYFKQP